MLHLTFEDFLEALIRMSCMKSLPFDAEIEEVGVGFRGCAGGGWGRGKGRGKRRGRAYPPRSRRRAAPTLPYPKLYL